MDEFKGNTYELYVISQDPSYKELFDQIEKLTFVVRIPNIEDGVSCKAIYVDGNHITVSDLKQVRAHYPTHPIFYRLSNIQNQVLLKNTLATCAGYQVQPIPEELTREQIKEEIEKQLFQKVLNKKQRIASFFGTHSGAGVSTTIMNVADLLAKSTDNKVLVLSLNPWDAADYFLGYRGRYLNDLKIDMKTKSLTKEKILNSVYQYPNSFYHLAGNLDIKLQRFFKIEEVEYLLQKCRELFDVILVDGGPHFDNACYAQAFRGSDLRFLVTTQEPKGFSGYWPHVYKQLLEPLGASSHDFMLILNQFSPENALATERDIAEQLNMTILSTVPHEGVLGSSAITQKKLLHENGASKEYKEALIAVVRVLIDQYQLNEKDLPQEQKKGFFSKLLAK